MCEGILVALRCDQIRCCIPVVLCALQLVSDHSYQRQLLSETSAREFGSRSASTTSFIVTCFKSCLSTLQKRGNEAVTGAKPAGAEFTCADLMNCTRKLQQVTCDLWLQVKSICSVQVGCVDCISQKIIPKKITEFPARNSKGCSIISKKFGELSDISYKQLLLAWLLTIGTTWDLRQRLGLALCPARKSHRLLWIRRNMVGSVSIILLNLNFSNQKTNSLS